MMMHLLELLNQNQSFIELSLVLFAFVIIFLISWLIEPRRLLNGILFTAFLIMLGFWLTVIVMATKIHALRMIYVVFLMTFIVTVTLVAAFSWLFFLWNAYFVWKHEGHTLTNSLTFFTGLVLLLFWVIALLSPLSSLPNWTKTLLYCPIAIILYLLLVAYNFLVNLALYQLVPRHYHQDYLIVLGAGLSNGDTVTPLLAGRINRAIEFAQKQVAKGQSMPKLIMSGGQGNDEKIAEAQAMAEYALAHGIDPDDLLLETESKNTSQNMQFSAQVAAKDFGNNSYRAKFFSNNYHILRAALVAKSIGLKANGVGCYTRFYYLPNAIVREFAGVLLFQKKRHLVVILGITVLFMIYALLQLSSVYTFINKLVYFICLFFKKW
ncbi:YdcF family protein [Lactobacillus xylocopicola]